MLSDQLTIVAQFDDLQRNRRILTQGIETEFERFVRFQEEWRHRLATSDEEKEKLLATIKKLESANSTLELKLKHARSQLDSEIRKRKLCEQDKQHLEQQIGLVRELLNDKERNGILDERDRQRLELINSDIQASQHQYDSPKNYNSEESNNKKTRSTRKTHKPLKDLGNSRDLSRIDESVSLLSDCDIYDKTEDDLDVSYLRSGRKWKRSGMYAPGEGEDSTRRTMDFADNTENKSPERKKKRNSRKKHRRSRSADTVLSAKLSVAPGSSLDVDGSPTPKHRRSRSGERRPMRKCNSATTPTAGSSSCEELYNRTRNASAQSILRELNRQVTPPSGLRRNNSNNNLRRPHTFMPRTSIKPGESCIPCGKRIGFGKSMLKCKDCRAICHDQCREEVPLPCIALVQTPSKNTKNLLEDYAPSERPYIPSLVVHCVQEVENRGLEEQGIYRVPGAEKEVRELKDKFYRGKAIPNLSNIGDINVVCGCLKAFFKDLKEPLLTMELWHAFTTAADLKDKDEAYPALYQAISELPQANRDTLAFLMLHLQKVSESPQTLMTVSNLSTVFGPTLVGYSVLNPEPMQMMKETRCGQKVVEALMHLSPDYWEKLMNVNAEMPLYPSIHVDSPVQTPSNATTRGSVYESMLGPVLTPTNTPSNTTAFNDTMKRGWFTTPGRSRGFFASPTC